MNVPLAPSKQISIVPPASTGEKLLFQVFDNAAPIGYARLRKVTPRKKRDARVTDFFDPTGISAYELKMIEVSQNYRQAGVGTSLLQEVIHYCRANGIGNLSGEIKGDVRTLRHWYRQNGFTVDCNDRIQLKPVSVS